jgi:tetratricopeptide (TPR) repeat protein/CHAT domain-containing protein
MLARWVWRAVVVIALMSIMTSNCPKEVRAQAADELTALQAEVYQLYNQAKFDEAVSIAVRYVTLARQKYGDDHTEYATAIAWLSNIYQAQGRYPEAEQLHKRALAIREKALGPEHPDVAQSLNNLAELYRVEGRYPEAEPLVKRALAIREKALGPEHPDVAQSLANLAALHGVQGRNAEAELLSQRALAIREKALGPEHPDVAQSLANLAALHGVQGRYAEIESLLRRALAIREKALGPEHPDVAQSLATLGVLYGDRGRYAEAEPLVKRALAIREKALGPEHPDVAQSLNNLASLCFNQGRYAEAEPLNKRALAIVEKALGPEHFQVGATLNNLAFLYREQGRYAEAEPLYKRALAIVEKALGAENTGLATTLNNLALLYGFQGRYAEAEPLYKRALAIIEKALGPEHPAVAPALNNLTIVYRAQDRYAEAEPLVKRALAIFEKVFAPEHPFVAITLMNLANLYRDQGRYTEAEPVYTRALAIFATAYGPQHPAVASALGHRAVLALAQRDWEQAADYWRRATEIIERRAERGLTDSERGSVKGEATRNGSSFLGLIKMTDRLAPKRHGDRARLGREIFETAQWAQASEAATSLTQMAARSAVGNPALAVLVRERQDLVGEWLSKDKQLITAKSEAPARRNPEAERSLSDRLASIDGRLSAIDGQLAKDFPDYSTLVKPTPLSVTDVQALLGYNEALVLFLDTDEWFRPTPEETFIWVITKSDMRWVKSELGTKALSEHVAALRCGLDATFWDDATDWPKTTEEQVQQRARQIERRQRCEGLVKAPPRPELVGFAQFEALPFDAARAHALYKALFDQIADLIEGKHLLIVPSGPLTSLPFSVLVTDAPKAPIPATLAEYRSIAWLGTRQPITVLPSVSSLQALRAYAKTGHATRPLLGIGNPLLQGQPDLYAVDADRGMRAAENQVCPQQPARAPLQVADAPGMPTAGFQSVFRGAHVDIAKVREWPPLPETADELCQIRARLGVPESDILLGARATEGAIKDLSSSGRLAEYQIVHFATHGALSGQVEGSAEPGLILTPPPEGTTDPQALERDDGYLTASEIAALKLNADWVILSACNTAAGTNKHAEALSGLARAFFYAGARALLLSHWEVGSNTAVALTTRAYDVLKSRPEIGRAEAMRISMYDAVASGPPWQAHPSQWAPFVVVGEGAASR